MTLDSSVEFKCDLQVEKGGTGAGKTVEHRVFFFFLTGVYVFFSDSCFQILEKDRAMQLGDDDRDRDRVILDKTTAPGRTERKINCC